MAARGGGDEEKGWGDGETGLEVQAHLYRERMRQMSLAELEGRVGSGSTLAVSVVDGEEEMDKGKEMEMEMEKDEEVDAVQAQVQKSQHGISAFHRVPSNRLEKVAERLGADEEATLVAEEFPKTHSMYLEKVVAAREEEKLRSLRSA